ncbi:hypothetical protein IMZ48_24115, partial [Candidatus Bathyarchaeota archaeon]|nr:hypothetical protein [Candidatus Bathyarchaeota archaeon]
MKKDDNTSEAGSSPRSSPDAESEAQATKKRKTLEEIEIDASLPEPPSKKAKRALKKGKPVTTKSANADSDDDLAGEDVADKKKA